MNDKIEESINPQQRRYLIKTIKEALDFYEENETIPMEDFTPSFFYKVLGELDDLETLVNILNSQETSESGRIFNPTFISSCRALVVERLKPLVSRLGIK